MACWDYKFRTTESVDVNIVQNDRTETGCYVEGPKLIVSLIFVIIVFSFTSVMVMVGTNSWQSTFLTITLVLVNIYSAIFQVWCLN